MYLVEGSSLYFVQCVYYYQRTPVRYDTPLVTPPFEVVLRGRVQKH